MKIILLFCVLILGTVKLNADNWALIIGIDHYSNITGLPKLNHVANDIHSIKSCLESEYVGFQPSKVLVLENDNANLANLHRAFKDYLSQAKKNDFLFIYFVGHSFLNKDYHWLLHDSDFDDIERSALSFEQLAYLIKTYLKAQNIFICNSARHSKSAMGKPKNNILDYFDDNVYNLTFLDSCGYDEQNYIKNNYSIFGYFLTSALMGKEYLHRLPDYNKDGLLTISELSNFLAWAVSFSGFTQHPYSLGNNDYVIVQQQDFIQIVGPVYVKEEPQVVLQGFIRSLKNISAIQVNEHTVTPQKKNNLYWFEAKINTSSSQALISCYEKQNKVCEKVWKVPLGKRGWYGEWMPLGLNKSTSFGLYEWTIDSSTMVYIPQGKSIFGAQKETLKNFFLQLQNAEEELQQLLYLLKDEEQIKSILAHTLQETNHSIAKVNNKMEDVSSKLKSMDETPEIDYMEIPISASGQSKLYYQRAQSILSKCYNDLQVIREKQVEYQNHLSYVEYLQELQKNLYRVWGQTHEHTDGYYIDIYEITNKQYLKFCNQTARPYPPNPWWQENYIYDSPDFPVVNVSWEDAMAYTLWAKKTLPSEKEWEKACRGTDGRMYPWGNEAPYMELVNAAVPSSPTEIQLKYPLFIPTEVSSHTLGKSVYGCYHMLGNVWEWCIDTPIQTAPDKAIHQYKIAKGGSFNSQDSFLYPWFHHPFHRLYRKSDLGFRSVIELKEK